MSNVKVSSHTLVGKKIIEASQSADALARLVADPDAYFEGAIDRNGQVIVVHVNTDEVTHLTIPSGSIVKEMLDQIDGGSGYGYPSGYDKEGNSYIDPNSDPIEAYRFRVGDYSFAQCG